MIPNPILEEIWAVKDLLNAESGGDIHVFCQQLRDWSAKNLPRNMAVCAPSELGALLAKEEPEDLLILREEPPEYSRKNDLCGIYLKTMALQMILPRRNILCEIEDASVADWKSYLAEHPLRNSKSASPDRRNRSQTLP